jgi:hypothetical protein
MSIISKIPDDSRVRYPVARFRSDALNGLGRYNWENAGNDGVFLLGDLKPTSVYLLERVAFYANVAEGDWLESMLTPTEFPRVSLRLSGVGGHSIYGDPFRCVNYVDNNEQLIYFRSQQKGVDLLASMYGQVGQVAGMVGKLTLLSQINFTVYEIVNKDWIKTFERDPARLGLTLRV